MDRRTVYRDEIPYETDILELQRFAMEALGLFAVDLIGETTSIGGFPMAPTAPASMSAEVGPGRIYKFVALESAPWGDFDGAGGLEADTEADHFVLKQGLSRDTVTFLFAAPPTVGHSVKYLIEGEFVEEDDADATRQFYNVENPNAPNAEDVSSNRRCKATLYSKMGTPGASPTIPAVTAGRVPIWVVTVAHTDTTITAGNIVQHGSAPIISVGGGGGGGSGLAAWQVLSTTYTAADGDRIIADTSGGAFTLTLPATPAAGDEVTIKGNFLTNNLTVGRNGSTIAGSATNLVMDKDYTTAFLVFDGTTWRV